MCASTKAGPVGPKRGLAGQHTATSPTGVEGAGGTCRGAGGRWQGQGKRTRTKPRPIGGRRGACGAWPGFEARQRTK